jgi:peptide deformylase
MAVRDIVLLGDPILREKAREVRVFDESLEDLVKDMFHTMVFAEGAGLAAPQIDPRKIDALATIIVTRDDVAVVVEHSEFEQPQSDSAGHRETLGSRCSYGGWVCKRGSSTAPPIVKW